MRRTLLILPIVLASAVLGAQGPRQEFARFIERYTDEWMRFHTNAAAARRYFTGAEQDALERQIEPQTKAQRDRELELIRRGLGELARFDRASLVQADRRSYDVIIELRERAKAALGSRFSLAEFHNRVLGAGRVPLDVLEQDINQWIAERRS